MKGHTTHSRKWFKMIARQVITYGQLLKQGLSEAAIKNMYASLKLFPTPFKGIYYIPSNEERGGWFIEKPLHVLTKSIAAFLCASDFYYSCSTAEEFLGLRWNQPSHVHIVNEKLSRKIDLRLRVNGKQGVGTYRRKKIAQILSYYGGALIFHKINDMGDSKFRETPYGKFATKTQRKIDRKRFTC